MRTIIKKQLHKNSHFQTLYPESHRKNLKTDFIQKSCATRDGKSLEVFWKKQNNTSSRENSKLVILTHGFEGHAFKGYVQGMAIALYNEGFDVLAWNLRGCERQIDLSKGFYNAGSIDDLEDVIQHTKQEQDYQEISLVGFSLGANITLRYLSEPSKDTSFIKAAVAISCPCDLESSTKKIDTLLFKFYNNFFLKTLRKRLKGHELAPILNTVKKLSDVNQLITPTLGGYKDGDDYYARSSSLFYLHNIKTPTLIYTAQNDPFLTPSCFPYKESAENAFITFETPKYGGHVGFYNPKTDKYDSEVRSAEFLRR